MRRWLTIALVIWLALIGFAPALGESGARIIRLAYDDDAQTPALRELAEAYMMTHARVTVELTLIAKSSYYTRLESLAMGSVLPDVFVIHPERVIDFVSAGALMDLSAAKIDFSAFPEAVVSLYRFNGTPYAVPKDVDGVALAYNKSLFQMADVAMPDATWDWHKLRQAALDLTDPERGIWGFGAPNDGPDGYYNLIYQNGGFVYRDGRSGFGEATAQEAVQFWVDLALVDRVSPTVANYPDIQPSEWLMTGEVAMQFVSGSQISALDAASTLRDNFDVALLPMLKQRATVCSGAAFAAAANTSSANIVLEFMSYLATPQAAQMLAGASAVLPAHAAARIGYGEVYPTVSMKIFSDMMEFAVPMPISPMRSVWAPLEEQAMDSVYRGEKGVPDALNALHEQIMALESE